MKRVKEGAKWTWSALRPGAVIGFSLVRGCFPFSPPFPPPCASRKHDIRQAALLVGLPSQQAADRAAQRVMQPSVSDIALL